MPTESINRSQIPQKNLRDVLYAFSDRKPHHIGPNMPGPFKLEMISALFKRHAKSPHSRDYDPELIRDLKAKINFMLDFNRALGIPINIIN